MTRWQKFMKTANLNVLKISAIFPGIFAVKLDN